jgi:two-component system chemotaxis response regulator CheB
MHTMATRKSLLAEILSRAGPLPACVPAAEGEKIHRGQIYVAPSGVHMVIRNECVELVHGPKVNGHRPAVDPLFRSAAAAYGPRVVGVVLTGGGDCGAGGVVDIKKRGGLAIAQEPLTAVGRDMPEAALATGLVDHRLPISEIAPLLDVLSRAPEREPARYVPRHDVEPIMDDEHQAMTPFDEKEWENGNHTDFSCPDCGGVLRQVGNADEILRFRCRIGHALSAQALRERQEATVEIALSAAMRAMSERAELLRRVAGRPGMLPAMKDDFERRARDVERHADVIRDLLRGGEREAKGA